MNGTETEDRASLSTLATLDTDELLSSISRALPDGDSGQVEVAAFNSSI